jgi:excisionase family DNA binding protein
MESPTENPQANDNLWTVDEVAAFLRCTVRHVHNLCRAGLPHVYVGRLLRFDPIELREYLLKRRRIAA